MVQQGRFRILAAAAPRRLAALPEVPTLIELGYPQSSYTSHFGFFAPATMPEPVLKRLHAEINAALALPDVAERLTKLDNVVAPASMAEFALVVRREYDQNAKLESQVFSR
jgi:tripartite-type tricarboxylate transporter receptor subunit TctC